MNLTTIRTIGNLGAGTMGHATALQFAMAGYPVILVDQNNEALDNGMALIKKDLHTFADNHIIEDEEVAPIMARITTTTDNQALAKADFIIESVVENVSVKKQVWAATEQIIRPDTICATNTSGLDPTEIATVLTHPERFVVAHFWNPAQLMPLVEVVPGEATAQATVTTTLALLNKIGKHAVPLQKASLGFVGNRIQLAVLRECLHIVNQGIATPEAVDDIVKYSLGRRWGILGPIVSADLGGLDVFDNISKYLYADLSNTTGEDVQLKAKVDEGHLGLKTGQGFYDWQGHDGAKLVADRDQALLDALASDQKKTQK
ncbi:3-hydroxyacyl-CoA dehydrogenase family protein [Secundilactobacillus collinoides]|nr:3-hydroxyacyl-CoA dehydrogenase family protein [Secundilactobacillus collinoides]KZL40236.1 3-hydroxybutyryl-CoA dehydrogenase [Secundilactobacillus collinoides]